MADDILRVDQNTGDAIRGRSIRAGRCRLWETLVCKMSKPVGLLGRPVDFRLGLEPVSVCITSGPKIHAPNHHQGECSMKTNAKSSTRYIALDIHKHYAVVAAVDREGQNAAQASQCHQRAAI